MNEMQIFSYGNEKMRTVEMDGELWWVLRDVCAVLGIVKPENVAARLDEDEKGTCLMGTPSGAQNMVIINEPGLYNVILRSQKPEAKDFKRWVTHEVLPQIRNKGAYTGQQRMTAAQILAAQASLLVDMEARMNVVQAQQEALSERVDMAIQVFSRPSEDHWKEDMDRAIKQMCVDFHQSVLQMKGSLYEELERTVNCNINIRLTRLKQRMSKAGVRYRDVHRLTKLDAIAADKSLRAVFESLVRERQSRFAIQHGNIIKQLLDSDETEVIQDE